jgi:hypothetical protein
MDAALRSISSFASSLLRSCDEYWGSVGIQPQVKEALEAMVDCWDLEHLLSNEPNSTQLAAFGRLAEMLRPFMRFFRWPGKQEYSYVQHLWPTQADLAQQYLLLCERLRQRARLKPWSLAWFQPVAYSIAPIMLTLSVQQLVKHMLYPQKKRFMLSAIDQSQLLCVSCRIQLFLTLGDGAGNGPPFKVRPETLHSISPQGARGRTSPAFLLPGDVAILSCPPFKGKAVRVQGLERRVNEAAVLITACMDRTLVAPARRACAAENQHCWHAAYLLLHNRSMNSCSSNCERIGSLLHMIFEPDSKIHPARVCNRLRMREAGLLFLGGARDEAFVASIAEALCTIGKNPVLQSSARSKRRKRGDSSEWAHKKIRCLKQTADQIVQSQGRELGNGGPQGLPFEPQELPSYDSLLMVLQDLPERQQEHRVTHRPNTFDEQTQGLLNHILIPKQHQEGGKMDEKMKTCKVMPAPVFVQRARSTRDSIVTSTRRASLAAWLKTDEGLAWQDQRAQLWNAFCAEKKGEA